MKEKWKEKWKEKGKEKGKVKGKGNSGKKVRVGKGKDREGEGREVDR